MSIPKPKKCNYKKSLKLAFENFIVIIKIGLPTFLVNFLVSKIYVNPQKDVLGIAILLSIWSFFNIIHLFDIEFHGSGFNFDTGCFEYEKKKFEKNSLTHKYFFFIVTTVAVGYIIFKKLI